MDSGTGMVLSGNKPLPEPIMAELEIGTIWMSFPSQLVAEHHVYSICNCLYSNPCSICLFMCYHHAHTMRALIFIEYFNCWNWYWVLFSILSCSCQSHYNQEHVVSQYCYDKEYHSVANEFLCAHYFCILWLQNIFQLKYNCDAVISLQRCV